MVGKHRRFAGKLRQQRQRGGVELGYVQVEDIRLARQPPGPVGHAGHDDPLADVHSDLQAHDLNPIQRFSLRQAWIITRGQHGDLMAALRQGAPQSLGIDGQAGIMRAVIGQYGQDVHCRRLACQVFRIASFHIAQAGVHACQ